MARFVEAVQRSAAWAIRNIDGALALVLAFAVAVLDLVPDSAMDEEIRSELVSKATLLVLGLVATALLRDRVRQEPVELAMRQTSGVLAALPDRLHRLDEFERLLTRTQRTLEDMSAVRLLTSRKEIAQAHAEARRGTTSWSFKGGTGTYLRAVTLREIVGSARREKRRLTVHVEIIDPTNEAVCEAYSQYRRSLSDRPDGTGELWTTERTRKESYATVLAAFWYRQRFDLLDIRVGLSSVMTTFRWDLSDRAVIVTVESPDQAMVAHAGSFYYDSCSTELLTSFRQARPVPIERYKTVPLSEEPTVEEVRRLFDRIDLPLPRSFADRDVVDVIKKALRAKDPYET